MSLSEMLEKAEKGDAESQFLVADYYFDEDNQEHDYGECIKWLEKAVKQNHAEAQHLLAVCYENGYGVQESFDTAIEWYEKAVDGGSKEAISTLGMIYTYGEKKDYDKAKALFLAAQAQGIDDFICDLAQLYDEMGNPDEGMKLWETAADKNDAHAQYVLGHRYQNGEGAEENKELMMKWYLLAAENGSIHAMEELGDINYYLHKSNNRPNYTEAAKWFGMALEASDKNPKAYSYLTPFLLRNLIDCYYKGAKYSNQKLEEYNTRLKKINQEKKQKKLAEKAKQKEAKLAEKRKKIEDKLAGKQNKKESKRGEKYNRYQK